MSIIEGCLLEDNRMNSVTPSTFRGMTKFISLPGDNRLKVCHSGKEIMGKYKIARERISKLLSPSKEFFLKNQPKLLFLLLVTATLNLVNDFLAAVGGLSIPIKPRLFSLWFLTVYLFKLDGRSSIGAGLFFLSLCPFLLIFGKEFFAEQSAIFAYFFLVIGVFQQFVELLKSRGDNEDEEV